MINMPEEPEQLDLPFDPPAKPLPDVEDDVQPLEDEEEEEYEDDDDDDEEDDDENIIVEEIEPKDSLSEVLPD